MKWKKEGKFGVICINPIPNPQSPIPNPQSPIPNPSTRNLQKIFAKFIFIFFKLNLKKLKMEGKFGENFCELRVDGLGIVD